MLDDKIKEEPTKKPVRIRPDMICRRCGQEMFDSSGICEDCRDEQMRADERFDRGLDRRFDNF